MFQRLNVGRYDRLARAVAGVAVILGAAHGYAIVDWLLPVGLYGLASGAMGSCPIYSLAGRSTRRRRGTAA